MWVSKVFTRRWVPNSERQFWRIHVLHMHGGGSNGDKDGVNVVVAEAMVRVACFVDAVENGALRKEEDAKPSDMGSEGACGVD